MAIKKVSRRSGRQPSLFSPPQLDVGRTVEVAIKSTIDRETIFTLADGTKIHAKVMAPSVSRSRDKYNPNGDPIYVIQAGLILKTVVPKRLKRKVKS